MDSVVYFSDSNISSSLIVPHTVFSVIATITVGLRLYVGRGDNRAPLTVDEGFCVTALISNHVLLIAEGVAVSFGLGTDVKTVAETYPRGMAPVLQCIMAIGTLYGIACPLSKLAVLAMYYRIFSPSKNLRRGVWTLSSMVVAWGIAVIGVTIFACTPVSGFWDKKIPSKCMQSGKIAITIPNIVLDVVAALLPIREVWQLRIKTEKKLALASIFLFGGSQSIVFPYIASAIEICLAVIAACLPPCLPFFKHLLQNGVTYVLTRASGASSRRSPATDRTKPAAYTSNILVTIGGGGGYGAKNRRACGGLNAEGSFERLEDGRRSLQGSADGLRSYDCDCGSELGEGIHVRRKVRVEVDRHSNVVPVDIKNWVVDDIACATSPARGRSRGEAREPIEIWWTLAGGDDLSLPYMLSPNLATSL
ncbi:hypothetical protein CMUS01_15135 [Colletotrichum musicola]|uniref:Rhodopsin domain-containing protein n=1 Tax=Colletotrichum musicola TaxID=2175873 RepID=A0A8H6MNN2_9PEZI|nr:hypothetical protein CMUS01_15135 [Colletotrichum musicola]